MLETTTIVLAEDGRHVTLGQHTEPVAEEIEISASGLAAQGLGGWLCRVKGNYYGRTVPSVIQLRVLGHPASDFDGAIARFLDLRRDRLAS